MILTKASAVTRSCSIIPTSPTKKLHRTGPGKGMQMQSASLTYQPGAQPMQKQLSKESNRSSFSFASQ